MRKREKRAKEEPGRGGGATEGGREGGREARRGQGRWLWSTFSGCQASHTVLPVSPRVRSLSPHLLFMRMRRILLVP